jgi:hypothetical protein
MTNNRTRALSDVLDQLESAAEGENTSVGDVVETLGDKSFAALMLIFSLVVSSPASGIPGMTATVAVIVFLLAGQMILGRESAWLPGFITNRSLSTKSLCKGIGWLRKPVSFLERFMKPRLSFLYKRPWLYVPLTLILALTIVMPLMEAVPLSGSLAAGVIAIFAAGLLTKDGALAIAALVLLLILPIAVWQLAFD